MPILDRPGMLAGFHWERPDPNVAELDRAGAEWLPRQYVVDLHDHPDWEFYLQVDGTTTWLACDRSWEVGPGCLFLPSPGTYHRMDGKGGTRHYFMFAGIDLNVVLERLPVLRPTWRRTGVVFIANALSLIDPMRRLIREVSLTQEYRALGLRAAIDTLLIETSRLLEGGPVEGQTALSHSHMAVVRAIDAIDQRPNLEWRLADLAELTAMSESRLRQLFARELGISPRQYVLSARVRCAKEMLRTTDVAITEVALDLGFSSSQHFAVAFKKVAGQTARAWRAANRHV